MSEHHTSPQQGRSALKRMDSKTVVVTGASSGIGRATAELLAREGARVALMALPGDDLESALQACRATGADAAALPLDVGDSHAVGEAFEQAERLGPIEGVFNNAGISLVAPILDTTDDDLGQLVRTNLCGAFFVARAAAAVMVPRQRGVIVNTASELAMLGAPGHVAYTATKGGILAMTRALAAELAPVGIRVNSVCPGAVDTPLLAYEFSVADDARFARREAESAVAIGRIAKAEEIAAAVLFMLSEDSSYMTGASLVVDGGRTTCDAGGRAEVPSRNIS